MGMSENLAEHYALPTPQEVEDETPTRFERRESEQEEESQPLRKIGTPRSLKDIIKAKPRRAPWK
jgi:hypothetical protein